MILQTHILRYMFGDQELRMSMYEVGYSEAELKLKCKQARDNPLAGHGGDRSVGDAIKEARDNPLASHGERVEQGNNVTLGSRGNDTDYTLRRLARDNPELLDAIAVFAVLVSSARLKVTSCHLYLVVEKLTRCHFQ
jgi:hypothetical protein